ncbi:hypothetical protein TNCV_2889871 [Trichonephila clavipes]|nr:hypothetical protein TNCV_2889871 [Trichonephila clavipes]
MDPAAVGFRSILRITAAHCVCCYCIVARIATFSAPIPSAFWRERTDGRTNSKNYDMSLMCVSPRAESDLRVSLLDNGLVGPYSAAVLVTSFSPGSSTCASRVRSLNSDLHNNTEIKKGRVLPNNGSRDFRVLSVRSRSIPYITLLLPRYPNTCSISDVPPPDRTEGVP